MITLKSLTDIINNKLKLINPEINFKINPDGDEYKAPSLEKNAVVDNFIQGTAILLNDSIVPVDGITILSQTVGIEFVVPVKSGRELVEQEDGSSVMQDVVYQSSFEPIRQALATLSAQAYKDSVIDDDGKTTYAVSYTVTAPKAGDIMLRDAVGLSITYQISINFAIVQNGINTRNICVKFEDTDVLFTNITIGRTAIMESGAFNGSGGNALNYPAVTALSIELAVPALSDSYITQEHLAWLLFGEMKIYTVELGFSAVELGSSENKTKFNMYFGECCAAGQGIDNIGQSIRLVEALDLGGETIE